MAETSYALHFDRIVDAPRAFVCRAFTEPEHLKVWCKPDDAWSVPTAEIDLRVGGSVRFGLKPPGGPAFYEVGIFRDVSLLDRLVYTLRFEGLHLHEPTGDEMEKYETMITAEFQELAAGRNRVVVAHEGYRSREDRDRHQNGWPRFLDHLATYRATHARRAAGRDT